MDAYNVATGHVEGTEIEPSYRPGWALILSFPAFVCTVVFGATSPPAQPAREAHELLRTAGELSPREIQAVDRGEAIAKVLKTDRREIAIAGAVRVRAPRERLLQRYRDVSNLRKSQIVLQAGTFGSPPRPRDLAGLTFEAYDLDASRTCRPGDCAVRLSAGMMTHIQQSVDWKSPGARQQAAAAWQRMLADVAARYAANGDASLPEYANKQEPVRVQDELRALYEQFDYVNAIAPELARLMREVPRTPATGTEHLLYWTKADFGLRPVVTITHQIIYAPSGSRAFIATKRIYAVHYVDAGVGVTTIADDGEGGFYMVTVDRVRTRSLTGFSRRLVRSIVQGQSREALEKILKSNKRTLEE